MGIYKPSDRKSYYCKINGKRYKLHPDRKRAQQMWAEMVADNAEPSTITVRTLLKSYFDWLKANRAASTVTRREGVLKKFSREYGKLKANQVKPHHVTKWADSHWGDCSDTTRHDCMMMIQAAFSWAFKQKHIRSNPLAGLEKPRRKSREDFVPAEDWPTLLEACSPPFDQIVRFTLLTGVRPQESRRIEARHVKAETVVLSIGESKGKRLNRVIYLGDEAKELVDSLCEEHPSGAIFRNQRGNPWTKDAINCRMRRLKKKLGWPWLCMTVLRHSFAHAQVAAGTDSLILQQLMGHTDGRMLARVYAHADKATAQIRNALASTSHLLQSSVDPSLNA